MQQKKRVIQKGILVNILLQFQKKTLPTLQKYSVKKYFSVQLIQKKIDHFLKALKSNLDKSGNISLKISNKMMQGFLNLLFLSYISFIFITYCFTQIIQQVIQIVVCMLIPKLRKKKLIECPPSDRLETQSQDQFCFIQFKQVIELQKTFSQKNQSLLKFFQTPKFSINIIQDFKHKIIEKPAQVLMICDQKDQLNNYQQAQPNSLKIHKIPQRWEAQFWIQERNNVCLLISRQQNSLHQPDKEFVHMKNSLDHFGFHPAANSYLHKELFGQYKDRIPNELYKFMIEVYESQEQNRKRLNQKGWNIPDIHAQIQKILNQRGHYDFIGIQNEQNNSKGKKQYKNKSKQKKYKRID